MNSEAVKSMFAPGEVWDGRNTHSPCACGARTILEVGAEVIVWRVEGVCSSMRWPCTAEIVEARDGFLKIDLSGRTGIAGHTLTLARTLSQRFRGDMV
jgi:hypothetical protein